MLFYPIILFSVVFSASDAFRGLPSLPGYLNAFGSSGSGEEGQYYNRGLRVKTYPRVYNGLEQLAEVKEKDPVLTQIRQNVQMDIQKISDEVGLVSKQISAIYNNQSISTEDRTAAIQVLSERHPKIVPAILNLIGKIHKINHQNSKDPVLTQIRQNVQMDIQKISDEVGLVSKQISAIYNNQSISTEDRTAAIQVLSERHPKIVPAILNLIGKIHKINHQNSVRYDRLRL